MPPSPPDSTPAPSCPTETAWRELRRELQRFVAKRVRDPAAMEDIVQQILLRMHQNAATLRDPAALKGWAYRIARNAIADDARRRRPIAPLEEEPGAQPDEPPAGEGGDLNAEVASWLRPMLFLVPPEYAEAVALADLEGLPQREVAARLNLSLSGAKSRVQRGRRMLLEVLQACCEVQRDARGNVLSYTSRASAHVRDE